jgi:hypothetical protein
VKVEKGMRSKENVIKKLRNGCGKWKLRKRVEKLKNKE